jgi:hypothetical protein
VSVIRDGILPPDNFETSSRRRLREAAEKAQEDARAEETRLQLAYEDYLQRETDAHVARLEPGEYEARLTAKVEALTTEHATFAVWAPDKRKRIAQTALAKEIRSEISYRLFDFNTFCRVQKLVPEPLGQPRQAQQANVT